MTLEQQCREWLDIHVSDQEGREDIIKSLTAFVEQRVNEALEEAAASIDEKMVATPIANPWNGFVVAASSLIRALKSPRPEA